jgi:hypothetical protein
VGQIQNCLNIGVGGGGWQWKRLTKRLKKVYQRMGEGSEGVKGIKYIQMGVSHEDKIDGDGSLPSGLFTCAHATARLRAAVT